jgi:hypothetical protein
MASRKEAKADSAADSKNNDRRGRPPEKKVTGATPELPVIDFKEDRVDVSKFCNVRKAFVDYIAINYEGVDHILRYGAHLPIDEPTGVAADASTFAQHKFNKLYEQFIK